MKPIRWSSDKNDRLIASRGVSFDRVVMAMRAGGLLDITRHPNPQQYPEQRIFVVLIDAYVHLVPFVEDEQYIFLKTIIPSRKATRRYLKKEPNHD